LVLRIKQLVFGEGLTLAGVRRRLEEEDSEPSVAALSLDDVLGGMARSRLRQLRSGLEAIMKMLEKDTEPSVAKVPRVPKVPKVPREKQFGA
jgi:hypothetical protein